MQSSKSAFCKLKRKVLRAGGPLWHAQSIVLPPFPHSATYDAVKCATAAGKLNERCEPPLSTAALSHLLMCCCFARPSSHSYARSPSLSLSLSGYALWLSLFALARWANTKWANWQTQSGKQTLLWVIVKCSTHAHMTAHAHTYKRTRSEGLA